MKEDFLHYVWKYKKFELANICTTLNDTIEIVSTGVHNHNSGPDFFNSKIRVADQLWAGNVEIHLKSSDWYAHHHQTDTAYDNVILHVVWEHDTEVFRKDNTQIPVLVLKDKIHQTTFDSYQRLFANMQRWIPCENDIELVDDFAWNNWIERLYVERLEQKSALILQLLKASNNDWEAVLFKMLAKNFGLKVNGDAFFGMANSIDFSIVRKQQSDPGKLEALFFGQANLLDGEDPYQKELRDKYDYLQKKFQLTNVGVPAMQFFRLRPSNFPTIRLSQLADLYQREKALFSALIQLDSKKDAYSLFQVKVAAYWQSHYSFGTTSKKSVKKMTKSFIDLLLINTIIPIKFCYAKHQGKEVWESLSLLAQQIDPEQNGIVSKFEKLGRQGGNAMHTQSLLQLKNEYCQNNKCLQCAVGNHLLGRN